MKPKLFYLYISTAILIALLKLPILLTSFINVDDSIYAVTAMILLKGGVLYTDCMLFSPPLISFLYALMFRIFGINMIPINMLVILLTTTISWIIYLIVKNISDKKSGITAACLFLIFSYTYEHYDMLALNREWLVIFFSTTGVYFIVKNFIKENKIYLLCSGIFFGLSFLSKQLGAFDYIVFFCFYLVYTFLWKKNIKTLVKTFALSLIGFTIPLICLGLYLIATNSLMPFLFNCFSFMNNYYVNIVPLQERILRSINYLFCGKYFVHHKIFIIFFVINSMIWLKSIKQKNKLENKFNVLNLYMLMWVIFAYIAASASGRFFGHYFIQLLPACCIIIALTLKQLFEFINSATTGKSILKYSLITIVSFTVIFNLCLFSKKNWPFIQTLYIKGKKPTKILTEQKLVDFVKQTTTENDRIFVWGFYPKFYVLTERMPATQFFSCGTLTGLIPWENHQPGIDTSKYILPGSWEMLMQDLNKNKPKYILDTSPGDINSFGKYPIENYPELDNFIKTHYEPVTALTLKGKIIMKLFVFREQRR